MSKPLPYETIREKFWINNNAYRCVQNRVLQLRFTPGGYQIQRLSMTPRGDSHAKWFSVSTDRRWHTVMPHIPPTHRWGPQTNGTVLVLVCPDPDLIDDAKAPPAKYLRVRSGEEPEKVFSHIWAENGNAFQCVMARSVTNYEDFEFAEEFLKEPA